MFRMVTVTAVDHCGPNFIEVMDRLGNGML
jgi:hypothetical protein